MLSTLAFFSLCLQTIASLILDLRLMRFITLMRVLRKVSENDARLLPAALLAGTRSIFTFMLWYFFSGRLLMYACEA